MSRIDDALAKEVQDNLFELSGGLDIKVHSYSGRAMYNRQCLGITGDPKQCNRAIAEVIELFYEKAIDASIDLSDNSTQAEYVYANMLHDNAKNILRGLLDYSVDQMGLDVVYYWSNISYDANLQEDDSTESKE